MLLYGVAGGTAGLHLGLEERWWETRALTFSGGWLLLGAASRRLDAHWPVVLAALVLSAPVWWHALKRPRVMPMHAGAGDDGPGWSRRSVLLLLDPDSFRLGAVRARPGAVRREAGLLPLVIAIPYLSPATFGRFPRSPRSARPPLGIAVGEHWDWVERCGDCSP